MIKGMGMGILVKNTPALLTEFIGTFFLVLTVGLNVAQIGNSHAALSIGAMLMVMVYAGGPISGGHYNPAVSLAVYIRNPAARNESERFTLAKLLLYILIQTLAGFVAAMCSWGLTDKTFAMIASPDDWVQPCLAEFLYTFALAYVVLCTATATQSAKNQYFGLAIGMTVMAGAYAAGSISGASFNPAVATGPTIVHAFAGEASGFLNIWMYWVFPLCGGFAAASAFHATHMVLAEKSARRKCKF